MDNLIAMIGTDTVCWSGGLIFVLSSSHLVPYNPPLPIMLRISVHLIKYRNSFGTWLGLVWSGCYREKGAGKLVPCLSSGQSTTPWLP